MGSMGYIERINRELRPVPDGSPRVIDLFAGAGGLSLGFEAAGFAVTGFEMNSDCCETYRKNLVGECHQETLHLDTELPEADVVIGGPPCQPFSVAGNQRGREDERNGFPAFVSAVRRLQPTLFLIENVRGVFYRNRAYIDRVCDELESLGYEVEAKLLNAVDFGVPQRRERVVIVGSRGAWQWPGAENAKVSAGEALGDLAFEAPADGLYLTSSMDRYIASYEAKSKCVRPRDLHLDQPSRTLTCRNLAGATSDMMRVKLTDGRRRRLRVEEAARLQSFPDWWTWAGSRDSAFNQVGNAVAPLFALALARSVRASLEGSVQSGQRQKQLRLI